MTSKSLADQLAGLRGSIFSELIELELQSFGHKNWKFVEKFTGNKVLMRGSIGDGVRTKASDYTSKLEAVLQNRPEGANAYTALDTFQGTQYLIQYYRIDKL